MLSAAGPGPCRAADYRAGHEPRNVGTSCHKGKKAVNPAKRGAIIVRPDIGDTACGGGRHEAGWQNCPKFFWLALRARSPQGYGRQKCAGYAWPDTRVLGRGAFLVQSSTGAYGLRIGHLCMVEGRQSYGNLRPGN